MKSLVSYYSRTNITKRLAEHIAKETNADIEEIKPKVNYSGKLGYARGIKDSRSAKIIEINTSNEAFSLFYHRISAHNIAITHITIFRRQSI